MFTFALILFIALIGFYGVISFALVYHMKKYRLEGDLSRRMAFIFIGVSLFLIVAAIITFFSIPWDELSLLQYQ